QVQMADSIRRANPQAAPRPAPPAAAPPRRPAGPAPDTTPAPRPSAPIPETYAIVRLTRPLAPATSYRLRADSLRSLMGVARSRESVSTTPRPRSAPDTTRPRPASAPAAPPVRRPPGRLELSLRLVRE